MEEPGEECDGASAPTCTDLGFESGTATCSPACDQLDVTACKVFPSEVVLNEIDSFNDTIELFNRGNSERAVNGWTVVDRVRPDAGDPFELQEPRIAAGGFVLLFPDTFGIGEQDNLTLRNAAGQIVDYVEWDQGSRTLCRDPDGGAANDPHWSESCFPTPGAPNQP